MITRKEQEFLDFLDSLPKSRLKWDDKKKKVIAVPVRKRGNEN